MRTIVFVSDPKECATLSDSGNAHPIYTRIWMQRQMDEALPGHSLNRQQFPPSSARLRTALSCPSTPLVLFQSPRSSNWIICSNSSCRRFSRFSFGRFFPWILLIASVFLGFPLLYACLIATIYTASGLSGFGFWWLWWQPLPVKLKWKGGKLGKIPEADALQKCWG